MARRAAREAVIATTRRNSSRGGCAKYLQSVGIIVVFGAVFAVAGGFFLWKALTDPYRGFNEPVARVEVKRGWKSSTILRHLQHAGVLRDDFIPLLFLKTVRRGDSLKAGIYEFRGRESAVAVLDKLVRGDVAFKSVTIREGLDHFAIADLMIEEGFGTKADWEKVVRNTDLIRDLDPRADSLEGYLFPDTYKLAPGSTPATIAATMVQNFRKQFGDELAYISTGLDLHDTVTLASIVETEARLPQERPVVAAVYLNRIRLNMPLQADPTVIYAMKVAKRWNGNIRKVDLQNESAYNTYRHRGFPPGPIANPGLSSLRAASAPSEDGYLYFVARNDGSHVFARNLAEHNHNVEVYQKQYWRDRNAK